jgi:hypothetical protein
MTVYFDADRVQPGAFPRCHRRFMVLVSVREQPAGGNAPRQAGLLEHLTLGNVRATLEQFAVGRHAPELAPAPSAEHHLLLHAARQRRRNGAVDGPA